MLTAAFSFFCPTEHQGQARSLKTVTEMCLFTAAAAADGDMAKAETVAVDVAAEGATKRPETQIKSNVAVVGGVGKGWGGAMGGHGRPWSWSWSWLLRMLCCCCGRLWGRQLSPMKSKSSVWRHVRRLSMRRKLSFHVALANIRLAFPPFPRGIVANSSKHPRTRTQLDHGELRCSSSPQQRRR